LKSRKASRGTTAAALLATLLILGLPACGSANDSTESTTGARPSAPKERAKGGVALKKIGSFDQPVYVAGAPGFPKLLFVVEQLGRISVLRGGHRLRKPFLDIRGKISYGGERGLLSVAFPPDYAQSRRFYVYYTDPDGNIRVDEFKRASATRAAMGSQRKVIGIPHPVNANHNGGQLQFLGNLLYFGTGDGGSGGDPPNNAQNKDVLLGKLLRIDPRPSGGQPYSVPASNPFVGKPGRDEIYSYGLRNPFRFSFDTSAKQPRLVIGDVGQDRYEEVDYTTVGKADGANFGWDAFEGFHK
jgi:glucose/arabinose dehydrogenase